MSDSIASLGFAVDSKGLDDATKKLGDVTNAAQKTEQQAGKTSEALSKVGGGQSAAGMKNAAQSADQLANSLVRAAREAQTHLNVTQAMETIVAKTGASWTQANAAIKGAIDAHKGASEAAVGHSNSLTAVSSASAAASRSIGGLASVVGSATSGLAAIATTVGTAAIAITKAGDEVERAKSRLTAITGSARDGASAFDAIQRSANATGVEFGTLASAVEKAVQGVNKLNSGWPVIHVGSNQVAADIRGLNELFSTAGKVMEKAGATAQEESRALSALASGIAKTGGLTADTFDRILDTSPELARAISNAFGYSSIGEFQKQLERTPITLQELERAFDRIKPAVDRGFDPNAPRTFEQASRSVTVAWNELLQTLAQTGAFNFVIGELKAIAAEAKATAQDIAAIAQFVKSIGGAFSGSLTGSTYSGLYGGDFSSYAGGGFGAGGGSAFSGGGGILVPTGDIGAINLGTDFSGITDGGAFASGGSFVVGGSGGTDSQTVTFKATPGEVVTVSTPDSVASLTPAGGGDDLADLLAKQTRDIVDAINGLKKPSTGSSGSSSNSPTLFDAAGARSYGGASPFGYGSSGAGAVSGGGGGGKDPFADIKRQQQEEERRIQQMYGPQSGGPALSPNPVAAAGLISGRSSGVSGFKGSFPIKTVASSVDGSKDAEKTQSAIKQSGEETQQKLDDVNQTGERTVNAVDDASRSISNATLSGWSKVGDALDSGLSGLGAALAAAIGRAVSGAASRSGGSLSNVRGADWSSFAGGGFGAGAGSDFSGGDWRSVDWNDITNGSGAIDSGDWSVGDIGGGWGGDSVDPGIITDVGGSAGGGNWSITDIGDSIDIDAGNFASGGEFTVPGSGNTDRTGIRFNGTPGERVTITPPGIAVSPLMLNPAAAPSRDFAGYSDRQRETTKTVYINVQQGISAETFLRSRAQIARGM